MVEVLKRGTPPRERIHDTHCRECSSDLRFKESEADYISDQRDGDAWKIVCPVCHHEIFIAVR